MIVGLVKEYMKKNNIISDWLDKYGDPEIYKKVEKELERMTNKEEPKQVKYTEDEVRELLIKGLTHNDDKLCGSLVTVQKEIRTANFNVWFEENKKK